MLLVLPVVVILIRLMLLQESVDVPYCLNNWYTRKTIYKVILAKSSNNDGKNAIKSNDNNIICIFVSWGSEEHKIPVDIFCLEPEGR